MRDALLPFRASVPLAPSARWRVAALWAMLGALLAAVWSLALSVLLARPPLDVVPLLVALVAGGALFFGALGYALVGIGNRLIARAHVAHDGGPGATDPARR